MHEGAITRSILDAALAALAENEVRGTAREVRVIVGVCQGLVPDAMKMFFDAFKAETPLAEAELVVELQRMVAHCPSCQKDFERDEPILICEECGSPMNLIKGKELLITAIEVEE